MQRVLLPRRCLLALQANHSAFAGIKRPDAKARTPSPQQSREPDVALDQPLQHDQLLSQLVQQLAPVPAGSGGGSSSAGPVPVSQAAVRALQVYLDESEASAAPLIDVLPAAEAYALGVAALQGVASGVPLLQTDEPRVAALSFRSAANQGRADARYSLAVMMARGVGTAQDSARSARLLADAARAGMPAAQFALASAFFHGHGVGQDKAEALQLYQLAARNGVGAAAYHAGAISARGDVGQEDWDAAIAWWRSGEQLGDPACMFTLASLLSRGLHDLPCDPDAAFQLYQRAADAGLPRALHNAATCLFAGIGTGVDLAAAASRYREAAEAGFPASMVNLGTMLVQGNGVAKDMAEGRRWWQRAAAAGDLLAREKLQQVFPDAEPGVVGRPTS